MVQQKLLTLYKVWLLAGLALFHGYFFYTHNATPIYTDLLFVTVYLAYRKWKSNTLPLWMYEVKGYVAYFILAYGMVLVEEFYAAFVNNLNEGFSFSVFFVRIGQFWAFNLLAFSGLIIGLALAHKWRYIKKFEATVFASLFGLFSEHVYRYIVGDLVVLVVYTPIVIFIYYLIFAPGISYLPDERENQTRNVSRFIRYGITVVIVFIMTAPFISTLVQLRKNYPAAFPPCSMIEC